MNPIYGLVLAGGKSRRMGRPKESLSYRGIAEPKRMYELLEELTSGAFYSLRPEQETWLMFDGGKRIIDSVPDGGPLAALLTAFSFVPGSSWLAVPVDMPFLDKSDLQILIESRGEGRDIIAFDDGSGSFEPMPAIYENTLAEEAQRMLQEGRRAIRGLGDGTIPLRLDPVDLKHLTNINTIGQRKLAMEVIHE